MGTKKYVIIPEWLTLAGLKPPRIVVQSKPYHLP